MAEDLTTLVLGVDSRPVEKGAKALDDLTNASGKAQRATDVLHASQSRLMAIIKGLAAAWAVWKVVDYIKDATMLAARYETLGVSMEVIGRNAGYNRTQMDNFASALQKTGISMTESRQVLMQMAQAQLNLNDATKLARVAQDAAVVGNLNSSEAFQRMVYGIQSAQVEILRTIGLNVSFEEGYRKLAAELHKNVNSLTQAEKAQARMNVVLDEGARLQGIYEASMSTASKQIKSMERYVEDLKVKVGQVFNEALTFLVFRLVDGFKAANKEMDELARNKSIETWATNLALGLAKIVDKLYEIGKEARKLALAAELESRQSEIRQTYETQSALLKDDAGFNTLAKRKRLILERDRDLLAAQADYYDKVAKLEAGSGMFSRAVEDAAKAREAKQQEHLNKQKSFAEQAAVLQQAYAGYSVDIQRTALSNLAKSMFPSDFPVATKPAAAPGDKKESQAANFLDDLKRKVSRLKLEAGGASSLDLEISDLMSRGQKAGVPAKELKDKVAEYRAATEALTAMTSAQQSSAQWLQFQQQLWDDSGEAIFNYRTQVEETIGSLEFEGNLLGKTAAEQQRMNRQREISKQLLEITSRMLPENAAQAKELADRLGQAYENLEKLRLATKADPTEGVRRAFAQFRESTEDVAGQVEGLMVNAFRAAEDALVHFAMTGELNFGRLAESIIADLIRIQIRMQMLQIFDSIGAEGGIASLIAKLFGFGGSESIIQATGDATPGVSEIFPVILDHQGGRVGVEPSAQRFVDMRMFDGAPRLHKGLRAGEFPAILEAGETVLPKGEQPSSVPAAFRVEIKNEGTPQEVVSARPTAYPDEMVLEIVTRDLRRKGPYSQALSQTFGLQRR